MQNLEYSRKSKYNSARDIYVDGNTVRKVVPEEMPVRRTRTNPGRTGNTPAPTTPRRKQSTKYAARLKARKAAQRAKLLRAAGIAVLSMFFLALFFFVISGVVENNELTNGISKLEAEYAQLQAQNDSLEYDIDNSISMDTVIKVATENMGMVRATNDQIINYKSGDDEYIQQVAQIPVN